MFHVLRVEFAPNFKELGIQMTGNRKKVTSQYGGRISQQEADARLLAEQQKRGRHPWDPQMLADSGTDDSGPTGADGAFKGEDFRAGVTDPDPQHDVVQTPQVQAK